MLIRNLTASPVTVDGLTVPPNAETEIFVDFYKDHRKALFGLVANGSILLVGPARPDGAPKPTP